MPLLWLCGTSGVGKSTVGWRVYSQVVSAGVKSAYIDFDQIGFCQPAPEDDPSNHQLKILNLRAIWPNVLAAGARCVVVSGVVDSLDVVRAYAQAAPASVLTLVRLHASPEELTRRVFQRGGGEPPGPPVPGDELRGRSFEHLAEYARGAIEYAEELERNHIGDVCVDTDGCSIDEVVTVVRSNAGDWPRFA